MDTLASRLRFARKSKELTQETLSKLSGLKQSDISKLERGDSQKTTNLLRLAEALGCNPHWLDSGDGDPWVIRTQLIDLESNPDYPAIRRARFKLQAGADGYAIENDDTHGLPVVFRRDWFELHNYKPEKMLAIRVAGASMEPSLFAGDLVIVNLAQDQPKDGNVFAVNYEGEMVIKRMVRDGGEWMLRSDNPDKVRFPDKRCHNGVAVLGEIVYKQSERI